MTPERALVPCPRLRPNGAACPNAAGVSGVCATHRKRVEPARRNAHVSRVRAPTTWLCPVPRATGTAEETIDQVLRRFREARTRAA